MFVKGLVAGGGYVKVGGTVWNTLKGGGTEKRGGETKILKRGKAGSRGGCFNIHFIHFPLIHEPVRKSEKKYVLHITLSSVCKQTRYWDVGNAGVREK